MSRKNHWKLYWLSLVGTLLFYGGVLTLCFCFPWLITFSILTFFYFFYHQELRSFFKPFFL